ncbi:MAG TPA: hypothetical protein VNV38_11835 [Stellaceae bacterium]|nr:hypothetical protein [Stellaceae bacterium]
MPAILQRKSDPVPATNLTAAKHAFLDRKDQRIRRAFCRTLRNGVKEERQLAARLSRCSPEHPCLISFCSSCIRTLRTAYPDTVSRCVNALWPGTDALAEVPITKFSAAPFTNSCGVPIRQLFCLDPTAVLAKAVRALQRLKSTLSFVGVHCHLDEDGHGRKESSWQLTLHGVVVGAPAAEVRRVLEPICPPDIFTPELRPPPLKLTRVSDPAKAVGSCIKPYFRRHVFYLTRSGRRVTRIHGLEHNELHEVTQLLRKYDLENRYMLIGGRWFNFVSAPADRYPFDDK